jgi:protoporphyrinogen oxidase
MDDWLIVGGGIKGMVAAYMLRERGESVTLLEGGSGLGGVMRSFEWNGLALDLGCHLFDNTSERTFSIMQALGHGEFHPVDVRYGSITEGRKTDEVAVPDFSGSGEDRLKTIVWELLEATGTNRTDAADDASLSEYLSAQYGAEVHNALVPVVEKIFRVSPDRLDWRSVFSAPIRRIRVAPDPISRVLKESQALDQKLAVSSIDDPLRFIDGAVDRFPHKNFYSSSGGLLGFCTRAEDCLRAIRVDLAFGARVQAIKAHRDSVECEVEGGAVYRGNRLLWCLDVGPLASLLKCGTSTADLYVPVPMVLYYFLVPEDTKVGFTYLHDFSPNSKIYRVSSPGFYGGQANADGLSYICCECPTEVGSELWRDPGKFRGEVWAEVKEIGVVKAERPHGTKVVKTPVSYKGLSRNYWASLQEIHEAIDKLPTDSMQVAGSPGFSKADIVSELEAHLNPN